MDWNQPDNRQLVKAILSMRTQKEVENFLRDLMTEGEIEEFAKRYKTAVLLSDNVPYSVIKSRTGLSSTTIARVSKWLKGAGGGYRSVIKNTKAREPRARGRGL